MPEESEEMNYKLDVQYCFPLNAMLCSGFAAGDVDKNASCLLIQHKPMIKSTVCYKYCAIGKKHSAIITVAWHRNISYVHRSFVHP